MYEVPSGWQQIVHRTSYIAHQSSYIKHRTSYINHRTSNIYIVHNYMQIEVMKSKIHCCKVTEANLNYMGSITIDEDLMDAANLIAGERVYIVNNNNGERFDTYIIKGERGSGCICLNGAAARKVQVGDIVIIMSYALMDFEEAKTFKPSVVFPDSNTNKLV